MLVSLERERSLNYLGDVYSYLKNKGYREEGPYMSIEGVLVPFLPASDPPLFREAVENSLNILFSQTPSKILSLEYLVALMTYAGRPKDFLRMDQILEQKVDLDEAKLNDIVKRHNLEDKWSRFKKLRVT